jgi:hypothetical protein
MNLFAELFQPSLPSDAPLHIGEAYFAWRYYASITAAKSLCQLLKNHTKDPDLLSAIDAFITDVEDPQARTLKEFMEREGIQFPTLLPDKPDAETGQIPVGAKFTDMEIANLLVVKLEALFTLSHMSMLQSLREDVGGMFLRFQGQLLKVAIQLKRAMHRHGWLLIPPSHVH